MKQITKRIITLAIAAATLVSLAGCGGGQKSASGSDDKVLTVYTARSESLNNLVIPNFEKIRESKSMSSWPVRDRY